MEMTLNEAIEIGKSVKDKMCWTDEELNKEIFLTQLVAAYLDGRGDCQIVVNALWRKIADLMNMSNARWVAKKAENSAKIDV